MQGIWANMINDIKKNFFNGTITFLLVAREPNPNGYFSCWVAYVLSDFYVGTWESEGRVGEGGEDTSNSLRYSTFAATTSASWGCWATLTKEKWPSSSQTSQSLHERPPIWIGSSRMNRSHLGEQIGGGDSKTTWHVQRAEAVDQTGCCTPGRIKAKTVEKVKGQTIRVLAHQAIECDVSHKGYRDPQKISSRAVTWADGSCW